MKRSVLSIALVLGACASEAADDRERGPIGKADAIGTCADACGDVAAAGDCWCDDLCVDFGDCCADRVEECVPAAARACSGPLFDAHPVDGDVAVEDLGAKVPLPFATCGAEMTYLYGLADRAPIADLLAGTGHVPVALAGGKTLVRLFWVDYATSDVGRYREVGVALATVESAVPLPEMPLVNDYSLVAAGLAPGVTQFIHRLILDGEGAELATALGTQEWGLDKRIGSIKLSTTDPTAQVHRVLDEQGALVARLVSREDRSPGGQLAELQLLAAAFGLPGPEALPPPAAESRFAVANRRIDAPDTVQRWSATYGPLLGFFHRFAPSEGDTLKLGKSSELATLLRSIGFEPRLTAHYPSVDVVFASE